MPRRRYKQGECAVRIRQNTCTYKTSFHLSANDRQMNAREFTASKIEFKATVYELGDAGDEVEAVVIKFRVSMAMDLRDMRRCVHEGYSRLHC